MAAITLRTYVFLDQMQDQLAGFIGTTARGYLPVGGVAAYLIETAPGLVINRLTDVALKATAVTPGILVVERSFGMLEVHHLDQGQVRLAGKAVLEHLGISEDDRLKPRVVSQEVIRGVEPYHAQILNKTRFGDMLIGGDSLFILEVEPAGYVKGWAAERAADVLRDAGARDFAINLGGDIIASGERAAGETWRIGVRHPDAAARIVLVIGVRHGAVATSGLYERGDHVTDARDGTVPVVWRSMTVLGGCRLRMCIDLIIGGEPC